MQKFGCWTILEDGIKKNTKLCRCECGTIKQVRYYDLISGKSTCCGCIGALKLAHRNYINGTHHLKRHPLYAIWRSMKARCLCHTAQQFKYYGGRGISICQEWKDDFKNFYDWAIKHGYKKGLSLDRINNNSDYKPSNCRWTTAKQQANNRRSTLKFIWNGELLPFTIICEKEKVNCNLVRDRLRNGWDLKNAIFTPKRNKK